MRKIVVSEFISLDGVVQAPGGPEEDTDGGFAHGGWSHPYFDPELMGAKFFEDLQGTHALLFGRRTWRGMADAWPGRAGDPFADKMNELPKYVASRTLSGPLPWVNSTLLEGDAAGAVARLKQEPGPDLLVMGSGVLADSLMKRGLVDEYQLLIHPLVLGAGRRLFNDGAPYAALKLVKSVPTTTGVIIATYQPADGAARKEA